MPPGWVSQNYKVPNLAGISMLQAHSIRMKWSRLAEVFYDVHLSNVAIALCSSFSEVFIAMMSSFSLINGKYYLNNAMHWKNMLSGYFNLWKKNLLKILLLDVDHLMLQSDSLKCGYTM